MRLALALVVSVALVIAAAAQAEPPPLAPWSRGTLDIHHISTGRGNAAFAILPDGTTLLIDAGALDVEDGGKRYAPLKVAPARPNASRSPGQWIIDYIRAATGRRDPRIDYAVITHFHSDHYGGVTARSPRSRSGRFRLSGITEIGDAIPIGTLIDHADGLARLPGCARAQALGDATFRNYRNFVAEQRGRGLRHEPLRVGSVDQIVPLHDRADWPGLQIRGLKADEILWTGGQGARALFPLASVTTPTCGHNENALSLALSIRFGAFDYFSGGDNTGLGEAGSPPSIDVESALAAIVGPVDVLTLDHHGNRDATNAAFLSALRPRVVVQQSWISDQPGGEVAHRLASRALWLGDRTILSTHLAAETAAAIGRTLSGTFSQPTGHILIRVTDGGARYHAYVLDDRTPGLTIRRRFGPFISSS